MDKILTFNVAEATELGTHCALQSQLQPARTEVHLQT